MYIYSIGSGHRKFSEDPDLRGGHPGVSGCTALDYNRFLCFKLFGLVTFDLYPIWCYPAQQNSAL